MRPRRSGAAWMKDGTMALRSGGGDGLTATLEPLADPEALRRDWCDLERRADGSFFLSWLWIGTWLEGLPPGERPHVLRATQDGRVVALAVLMTARGRRLGCLPVQRFWLHETGDPGYDALTVEYNGFLVDRDWAAEALSGSVSHLMRGLVLNQEIHLSGLRGDAADRIAQAVAASRGGALRRRAVASYRVDLDGLRAGGGDYLASLGDNTRSALRRSLRLYGRTGAPVLRRAASVEEALSHYEALKRLHTERWEARGKPGAFASPRIDAFHRRLIARGTGSGAVQLCRIAAGSTEIGYLYNVAWGNWIHNYQSGFHYTADNRLKPGMVSHYLAIEAALAEGKAAYDLMAGETPYKPRLAATTDTMVDLVLLPDRHLVQVAEMARRAKASLSRFARR